MMKPRVAIISTIGGAALVSLLVGVYLHCRPEARLRREVERLRLRGEPVSLQDIEAGHRVSPDVREALDAACAGYRAAEQILGKEVADRWLRTPEWDIELPVDRDKLRLAVDTFREAVDLAQLALDRKEERDGAAYTASEARQRISGGAWALRRGIGLAALLAHAEGRSGNVARFLRHNAEIERLKTDCEDPSNIQGSFYDIYCDVALVALLERVGTLPDEARRCAVETLQSRDLANLLRKALVRQRAYQLDHFRLADWAAPASGQAEALPDELASIVGKRPFLKASLAWLDATETATAATGLPPWLSRRAIQRSQIELCDMYDFLVANVAGHVDWRYGFDVISVYDGWTRRDACVIGLSCELFRSARGRYPAKLDELAPDTLKGIPPDPFTGKPFHYQLRDDGRAFIVYSVGDNLEDDGGVEKRPAKDDISWEGKARDGR